MVDNDNLDNICEVCGDSGVIDMGWSGDFHILYYCNYCDHGIALEDRKAYGESVMNSHS